MKRIFVSVIMLGFLVGPVYAQGKKEDPAQARERAAKKKNDIEIDQKYRAALQKTDQAAARVRVDPWSNMRAPSDTTGQR